MNQTEIDTLTAFFNEHGIVDYVYPTNSENRIENVQQWLDTIPNVADFDDNNPDTGLKQILHCLSFTEKVNIFSYNTASEWYLDILTLIENGNITDNLSKVYVDKFSQRITNMKLIDVNFNDFILALISLDDTTAIEEAFYLMVQQGLVDSSRIGKMKLELGETKRFLLLGLSTLPTLTEIETIIGL